MTRQPTDIELLLIEQSAKECQALPSGMKLPILFDVPVALILVAQLQLALKHPQNTGAAAEIARSIIESVISRMTHLEMFATVQLLRIVDTEGL